MNLFCRFSFTLIGNKSSATLTIINGKLTTTPRSRRRGLSYNNFCLSYGVNHF